MALWHHRIMSLIAVVVGLVVAAEAVLVLAGWRTAWLDGYSKAQVAWLAGMPAWAAWTLGAWGVLALVGALCLAGRVAAAAWMTGFAFLAQLVLTIWAFAFAAPPVQTTTEATLWTFALAGLVLSAAVWLYARGERRRDDGVL